MAVFPMFIDLKGKKCIVVGAGRVAYRKIELLLRYEAIIDVIAPEIGAAVLELEKNENILLHRKEYSEEDLKGAYLIVAATDSSAVNQAVYEEAVKRNIPINVVDAPDYCTFLFPSVIKRGDLSIGISTSGKYPALSKKLRKVIEDIITEDYSEVLELLSDFRIRVRDSKLSQQLRELEHKQVVDEFYEEGIITSEALSKIIDKYQKEL